MIFVGFLFLKQHRKVELPIGNEAFYVISLDGVPESSQNNIGRFEAYEDRARRTCGEHLKWTRQPGYLSNRRGAGLTKSFVDVLQHAYANDIDFAYIFEDDAVMLNPLFCSSRFRHQMWLQAPQHLVLILAGHSVEASKHAMETKHFAFRNITKHYGSYAWCIRRENFELLRELWSIHLRSDVEAFSPDVDLSRNFRELHQTTESYLLQFPQLFHHPAGFSNTWLKQRTEVLDKQRLSLFVKLNSSFTNWQLIDEYLSTPELIAELTIFAEPTQSVLSNLSKRHKHCFVRHASSHTDINGEFEVAVVKSSEPIIVFVSSNELPSGVDLFTIRDKHFQRPYSVLHYHMWPVKQVPKLSNASLLKKLTHVRSIVVVSRLCAIQARLSVRHCDTFDKLVHDV